MIEFHKVTFLPGTLSPNSFYFVENGSIAEAYVTDNAGVSLFIGNSTLINTLIDAKLAANQTIILVANIAARDALLPATINQMVLVSDASADATVDAGAALYFLDSVADTFTKVGEFESLDVVLDWNSIAGRPASTPAQIDAAVAAATHANRPVLDGFTEDATDGNLLYNGVDVEAHFPGVEW